MLTFANAGKLHHDHTHARGICTREFCMYLMLSFNERRVVAELCAMPANPLKMAETERSNPGAVQNDDFHLDRVW